MNENEIRPKDLLRCYLELCEKDAKHYFDHSEKYDVACVACGSEEVSFEFEKQDFEYVRCVNCGTLYQTPRPSAEAFGRFYSDSESSKYWADVFFPAVAEIRREKIFRPRVKRLIEMCSKKGLDVKRLVDVGAGYGIFLDEWRLCCPEVDAVAVEPSASLAAECRRKEFRVIEAVAQQANGLSGFADLVVCFEVLEHVDDPLSFLNTLKGMVRPGGYVFISTLCIDGFDLQMLWEKSTQMSPPHHINILSVDGFVELFKQAGLVDVDVSTPGVLDVDIIRNVANDDTEFLTEHRFLRSVLHDKKIAQEFQSFLSENRLSSHAWVFGQSPN